MKIGILNVLIILAIVASLCTVMTVLPAGAQTQVSSFDAFSMTSANAGQASGYTISFTGASALIVNEKITITFPSGCDLTGASLAGSAATSPYMVSVDGGVFQGIANPSILGQALSLPAPEAVAAGDVVTVTIGQAANIINPDLSQELSDLSIPPPVRDNAPDSPYVWQVSTEADTTLSGTTSQIFDYVQCNDYTLIPGQDVTVTGGGLTSYATVQITGSVSGVGSIAGDGTFTVTGVATGNTGTLMATDGTGRYAYIPSAQFTVLPVLTVTPASGLPGASVVVRGYNFINPASVMIAGNTIMVNSGSITLMDLDLDAVNDDFQHNAAIPANLVGGIYQLACIDVGAAGNPVATATYEVTTRQITVDPPAGAPGAMVVVSGIGFPKDITQGTAILIWGNLPAVGTITALGSITTDDTGAFTVMGNIPAGATVGAHGVIVYFNVDEPAAIPFNPLAPDLVQAQSMFTITSRSLTIVPDRGPLGTNITVSGGGLYLPNPTNPMATMTVGGILWTGIGTNGLVMLNSSGDVIPVTATASDLLFNVGNNTIMARHYDNPGLTASAVFEVQRPTFELDLCQGPRGTQIVGTGTGWLPGEINFVTISFTDDGVDYSIAVCTPDAQGNIWQIFSIPHSIVVSGTSKYVTFYAHDNNGNTSLIAPFLVTVPQLSVDPASGPPGTDVIITGSGFLPDYPVTSITLFGHTIVSVQDLPLTSASGAFQTTAVIPGLDPGGYALQATVKGVSVTTPFTVTGSNNPVTVEQGFATIDGLYDIVWSYDPTAQQWIVYQPDLPPWVSIFTTLKKGQGYWLRVSQDCVMTYGASTYNLYLGWNLIGWLG